MVEPERRKPLGTESEVEGCLSVPGIGVEMVQHKEVVVSGSDAEGEPMRFEAGRSRA